VQHAMLRLLQATPYSDKMEAGSICGDPSQGRLPVGEVVLPPTTGQLLAMLRLMTTTTSTDVHREAHSLLRRRLVGLLLEISFVCEDVFAIRFTRSKVCA